MRRLVIATVLLVTAGAFVPSAHGAASTDCPAEKICLYNQPNFAGKMIVQEGGRCQRPPADAQFGVIRSVRNRTTKKPDGGEWRLHTWTASDCGCSKTCAEQWDAEIRPGEQRPDLNPGHKSFEAVFIEPDSPKG